MKGAGRSIDGRTLRAVSDADSRVTRGPKCALSLGRSSAATRGYAASAAPLIARPPSRAQLSRALARGRSRLPAAAADDNTVTGPTLSLSEVQGPDEAAETDDELARGDAGGGSVGSSARTRVLMALDKAASHVAECTSPPSAGVECELLSATAPPVITPESATDNPGVPDSELEAPELASCTCTSLVRGRDAGHVLSSTRRRADRERRFASISVFPARTPPSTGVTTRYAVQGTATAAVATTSAAAATDAVAGGSFNAPCSDLRASMAQ